MAEEIVESGSPPEEGLDMANALDEISEGLGFDSSDSDTDDVNLDAVGGGEGEAKPVGEPATGDSAQPATAPTDTASAAPRTWRPEAAAEWAKLPPVVQAEIAKREDDIFKGLEGYKEAATQGKAFQSVIDPYMPILKQFGINPVQQVANLMSAHYQLATGTPEARRAMFAKLAQDYHIDLGQPAGEAPYEDPAVAALREKLSGVESTLARQAQREQETVRTQLNNEINAFAADLAHPYFDEVANDITALLRGNGAKDLADAYDKAVWANPVTRAKEQARLATENGAKAKKEAEERAAAARRATAANVKSRSKAASSTASLGSIEDTLNETLGAIRARA